MDFRICRDGIERDPYLKLLLSPPHMLFALQSQPHLGTLLPLRRVWCLLVLSKNVGTYDNVVNLRKIVKTNSMYHGFMIYCISIKC